MFKAYRLFVSVVLLVALGAGFSGYSVPKDPQPAPLAVSAVLSSSAAPRNYAELQQKLMGLYQKGLLPHYVVTAKAQGFDAETALGLPKQAAKLSDLEAIHAFLKLSRDAEIRSYAIVRRQNTISTFFYELAGFFAAAENVRPFVMAGTGF